MGGEPPEAFEGVEGKTVDPNPQCFGSIAFNSHPAHLNKSCKQRQPAHHPAPVPSAGCVACARWARGWGWRDGGEP